MFGLEKNDKGREEGAFQFDLEQEWKDPIKFEVFASETIAKTAKIKILLRAGQKGDDYGKLGVLLLGYAALLKTASRANAPHKNK